MTKLLTAGFFLALLPWGAVADEHLYPKNPISMKEIVVEEESFPEENLWIYTKGTGVREKGSIEIKLENISRIGKNDGTYRFHDFRPEIEYGITDRLTFGGELMFFSHDYEDINKWDPISETGTFDGVSFAGFELFTKYELLRPQDHWMGVALGLGYEERYYYRLDHARIQQEAWVPTIFLQKGFMDNRLQWAFKGKMELERREPREEDRTTEEEGNILEEEISFDLASGLSFEAKEGLWLGWETRWQGDFLTPFDRATGTELLHSETSPGRASSWDWNDWQLGDGFQYGLYTGPTVHYDPSNADWWFTGGLLMQIKGWGAAGDNSQVEDGRNWDEHERFHLGILVGYEFE